MSDLKEMIRQANETAVNKLKNAQPYWVDIKPAHEVLGIDKYTLLHAGPPIAWEEMCGPMRGAIVAVLKYEGLAENDEEALALAGSGKIKYGTVPSPQCRRSHDGCDLLFHADDLRVE